MTIKYLLPHRTCHTEIGTLKRGTIYPLDDANPRFAPVILHLTGGTKKKPTKTRVKVLTKEQADAHMAPKEDLEVKPDGETAEAAALRQLGDAESQLEQAKTDMAQQVASLETMGETISALEAQLADATGQIDTLSKEMEAMVAASEESAANVSQTLKDAEETLKVAETRAEKAEAELKKLSKKAEG